jgi:hypothetical protein
MKLPGLNQDWLFVRELNETPLYKNGRVVTTFDCDKCKLKFSKNEC